SPLVARPVEVATCAAAAASEVAAAARAFARTSLVHPELSAAKHLTIERLDRVRRVLVLHLNEAEAARPPRLAINGERAGHDLPVSRKELLYFLFCRREREVSDIDLLSQAHTSNPALSRHHTRTLPGPPLPQTRVGRGGRR